MATAPTLVRRMIASVGADDRLLGQAGCYIVVGATGYAVQLASFALLVHILAVQYLMAAIVAGVLALLNNFLLNRHWTFEAAHDGVGRQAGLYVIISAVFFCAQLAVLAILVGIECPKVPAEALAVLTVVPANFIAQRHIAFRVSADRSHT